MKKGFLTHPQFTDVYLEVVKISYSDHKRVKAKIRWWNKGFDGTNAYAICPSPFNMEFSSKFYNELVSYPIKA